MLINSWVVRGLAGGGQQDVMKLPYHVAVSLALSALVWLWLRSFAAALACFLAGVFVDLDHVPDYIAAYGWRVQPRHLFQAFEFELFDNIYIFLHAWEWLALALPILWLTGWPPVLTGLALGFGVHLGLDQAVNRHHPWSYFLAYRAAHRFAGCHYYGAGEYHRRLQRRRQSPVEPRGRNT